MKQKLISLITAITMVMSLISGFTVTTAVAETFSGGTGAADDPYQIADLATLEAFRESVNGGNTYADKFIKLTADIDLSSVCGADIGGAEVSWTPIGDSSHNFQGTFDGGNHKITGLYINAPSNDYQGLFGCIGDGMVKNLGVHGTVTGKNRVGGIVGYNGTVQNCYNTGTVTGTGNNVGGIVGYNGTVQNCYNTGTISSTGDNVGGLVGWNTGKAVENCYNTGAVSGASNVGGVVGHTWNDITKCYSVGAVTGAGNHIGGVVGYNNGGTATSCYYDRTVNTTSNATIGVTGMPTADFAVQTNFSDWDFDSVWKMSSALGRPILTAIPEPEPHKHPICGTGTCTDPNHSAHTAIEWTAWTSDNSLPADAGNYYLTTDVSLPSAHEISNDIKLCLNGHTVTRNDGSDSTSAIVVAAGGVLDLCDCSDEGKITMSETCTGRVITVVGTLNLYGGIITGANLQNQDGGGISTSNASGIINMYGGKITGNKTTGSGGGAATHADSAVFNMYGGEISNNTAENSGGGLYTWKGTVNIYGGKISGNTTETAFGGGISVGDGTITMHGGEISGNHAAAANADGTNTVGCGGGVYMSSKDSSFTMRGGKIINNTATGHGGGVYKYYGNFTMRGGEISGNTSACNGGGIYIVYNVNPMPTITVGGTAVVKNNTARETTNNVYMYYNTGTVLTDPDNPLADSAEIGITYSHSSKIIEGNPINITGANNADYSRYFKSDSADYMIQNTDDNIVQLVKNVTHNHPVCGASCTHGGAHTAVEWIPLTFADGKLMAGDTQIRKTLYDYELPSGNYYLADNITIDGQICVHNEAEVALCLNGKTLTRESGWTVSIYNKGNFTLCDCGLSGKMADNETSTGVGIWGSNISFTMYGGTISGGAAGLKADSSGNDNISIKLLGGTISGNTTDIAVRVKNKNNSLETPISIGQPIPEGTKISANWSWYEEYDGALPDVPIIKAAEGYTLTESDLANISQVTVTANGYEDYTFNTRLKNNQIVLEKVQSTPIPTATPAVNPTATPTVNPTATPTASPSATPTAAPTSAPTPTANPNHNVVVDVKPNTPQVTVDGLDEVLNEADPTASKVTITMTIESKAEDSSNDEHNAIKLIGGDSENIDYLDISLIKTVDNEESAITETSKTIKIVIPFDKTGKNNIKVYRYHGGSAELLSDNAENDEYYVVGDGVITVYANKFSTYAIGYDTDTSAPTATPTVTPTAAPTAKPSHKGGLISSVRTTPKPTATPKATDEPTAAPTVNPTAAPSDGTKTHKAYIVGYERKFNPDGNITRAETAAMLARLDDSFDENESYTTTFADVDSALWYYRTVGFAESQNIITGYEDGTFKPEGSITRAEFASMIAKFAELDIENTYTPFEDVNGHWAADKIAACYEAEYIHGYEGNIFRPDEFITRAEVVFIINRMLGRDDLENIENPFTDVSQTHWAYTDIMEAAVTHNSEDN